MKQSIGLLSSGLSLRTARYSRNAALHFLEGIMILVEDAPRLRDIDALWIEFRPGQFNQQFEICPRHAVLGRALRHAFKPL